MFQRRFSAVLLAAALATAIVSPVLAQNAGGPAPGGPGGGPGGPGGPGGFNWQDMRARMEQQMKQQLGVTDEEWTALQPKIDKVNQFRFQAMAGRFGRGMGGGMGGPGGPGGGNGTANPVMDASRDLMQVLQDPNASPELIKVKLTALRDAKAKAQEQLVAAQNELKDLLTARQEAVLVSQGVLD